MANNISLRPQSVSRPVHLKALGTSQSTCRFVSHHTTVTHVIELKALVATKNHVKITRQRDGKLGNYVGGRGGEA